MFHVKENLFVILHEIVAETKELMDSSFSGLAFDGNLSEGIVQAFSFVLIKYVIGLDYGDLDRLGEIHVFRAWMELEINVFHNSKRLNGAHSIWFRINH